MPWNMSQGIDLRKLDEIEKDNYTYVSLFYSHYMGDWFNWMVINMDFFLPEYESNGLAKTHWVILKQQKMVRSG